MKFVDTARRVVRNTDRASQQLIAIAELDRQIVAGIDNQARLFDQKLQELIAGLDNQSRTLNHKLEQLIEASVNQSRLLNGKLHAIIERQDALLAAHGVDTTALHEEPKTRTEDLTTLQGPPIPARQAEFTYRLPKDERAATKESFGSALAAYPLMIDAKTYNTSHPDYNSSLVRNFPGKIFNADSACSNPVFADLKRFTEGDEVPDAAWGPILAGALEEAKTVPHVDQVFERRAYIENYLKSIGDKYSAHYAPGWVNLDDALFLYWLVRRLNPKTIVQTGVCNGLSSAFMVLALTKNAAQGKLHVIDLPPVFKPDDPAWTAQGKVYGVVIPEGKSSGWIVPDAYRDRFEVWSGDAKTLLPKMVDRVDGIDLFYHDSDHTYDHMMFEFKQAKRKLRPGGLVVGDDVSWNASIWDFADEHRVPSYNFKGTMGVAFF